MGSEKPKGIDDAMKAGATVKSMTGDAADTYVKSVVAKAERARKRGEKVKDKPKAADVLVSIGREAELFHDDLNTPFAMVDISGHREILQVGNGHFREFLARAYFNRTGSAPNSAAVAEAMLVLSGLAQYSGQRHVVPFRVHRDAHGLTYDLTDLDWRVVHVTTDGWEVLDRSPIRFRRYANAAPQVTPIPGGSVDALRGFLRLRDDRDWHLLLSFIIGAFIPGTPRPVLVLTGEQGTAKSTTARVIRKLVDPAVAETVHPPRRPEEFAQMAEHAWVLNLDNMTDISEELSDALCRVVTGDGFQKRSLFTNDDDVVRSFRRIVTLNGIGQVVTKPDLLDRSVMVGLEPIPLGQRRTEEEFWRDFERERPAILGALFDLLAKTLRCMPAVKISGNTRMADFERIGLALELAIGWPNGSFAEAIQGNAQAQTEDAIEGNPVAQVLLRVVDADVRFDGEAGWRGTVSELLNILNAAGGDESARDRAWPKSAGRLGTMLMKAAPALRSRGVEVLKAREGHGRRRILTIRRCKASSAPSASPASDEETGSNTQERDPADRADSPDNGFPLSYCESVSELGEEAGDHAPGAPVQDPFQGPSSRESAVENPFEEWFPEVGGLDGNSMFPDQWEGLSIEDYLDMHTPPESTNGHVDHVTEEDFETW